MRITLLIVLIISALSKKFVDIYKAEKQIQKQSLYKCILNSNELRENIKVIYGDIQKAFINHYYLDIIKKLVNYNPKNNKILIQCSNELLNEEDDIVLERSSSSHSSEKSSSGSSTSRSSSSSGKSDSNSSKSSIGSNKSSSGTNKSGSDSNTLNQRSTKLSSGTNQPKENRPKSIQPKSTLLKSTKMKSSIIKSSRPKSSTTKSTEHKPTQQKPTENKHAQQKSNQQKTTQHKTTENKHTQQKTTQQKTNEKKPTQQKQTENKPTQQKTTQQKPNEQKHTQQKSNEQKSNQQKSNQQKLNEQKPTQQKNTENKQTQQKTTQQKTNEQKQKQNQQKQNQQKQNQQKPNEQKANQQKQNQQKPNEQKPNQQKQNQQKPNEQKQNQQKQNEQKPNQQKPNQQKPNEQKPNQQKQNQQKPNEQKSTQTSTDKNDTKNKNKNKNPKDFQPLQWINNIQDKINAKLKLKGKNFDIEAKPDSLNANFNVGKNTKVNLNAESGSLDVGGQTTISKGNQDTTYSLQGGYKSKDGQTDGSIQAGKTTKTNEGPTYRTEGHEIGATGTYINDGKKVGGGGSVTYTETHGNGANVGGAEISNTDTRKRTASGQVTHSRDGTTEVSGGYTDTNINKQAINVNGNEVSRSNYNTRSYEGNGSIQKTRYGYKGDGSFTRKNINGQTYQIGKTSYTQEQETGTVVNGGGSISRYGGNAHGSVENYDKNTYRMGYGDFQGEVSRKNYEKAEGNAAFRSRNGVVTGSAGASYAQGTQYTGKIGDAQFTGGREDKTSARIGVRGTKDGATANAQVQDSQRLSGSAQLGKNFKADGSAGMTQTVNAQATVNKNGASVKANYEEAYDAKLHAKVGNTDVGARGKFSDNTYGSASAQFKDGKFNAEAKVGKEYKVGAGLTVNGQNIVSADASLKGEASAKVKADKNGVAAQVGLNGQAQANVAFGQTEVKVVVKADFHFGISFDFKTGLHFDIGGGIHAEVDVIDKKTGKETDYKLFKSPGKPAYILFRKRRIVKKNMKKSQKNKILGQACRPSRHRA